MQGGVKAGASFQSGRFALLTVAASCGEGEFVDNASYPVMCRS